MASIVAENVTVDFPIYHSSAMSLRNRIVSLTTGGRIERGSRNIITVRALDGVSFRLRDGDRVGLVGHNGAGKSTLLRTLAGVYNPTAGAVTTEGRISTIFDLGANLSGELTGYENVIRMGMFSGLSKAAAQALIPEVESFTELGEFMAVPMHTYSAGMVARLTFAVATAVQPDILLIDEVLGAGDLQFQEKASSRMKAVVSSVGILVLATHSPEMLKLYCNKTLVFEHGKLVSAT